jgi:hypothetical protein
LLGAFIDEHPRVQFSLHSGNASEIVQLLFDDKVSVGLIEGQHVLAGFELSPSCKTSWSLHGKQTSAQATEDGAPTQQSRADGTDPDNRYEFLRLNVSLEQFVC